MVLSLIEDLNTLIFVSIPPFELPVPLFIYLKYCQYHGMTFSKNENKRQ